MLGHVLDVIVVLDQSVGVDTVLVGVLEALDEGLGVLLIEDDEDASQAALQLGDLPDALIALRLAQILEQTELAPVTQLVLVLPEAVGTDTFDWSVARAVLKEPVLGEARVIIPVVIGLQREPAAWNLVGVPELSSGLDQVVTDVHVLVLARGVVCGGGHLLGSGLSLIKVEIN